MITNKVFRKGILKFDKKSIKFVEYFAAICFTPQYNILLVIPQACVHVVIEPVVGCKACANRISIPFRGYLLTFLFHH